MYKDFVKFVQEIYSTTDLIPLHAPQFRGNEKKYLLETIESTFVSSVGEFVDEFERKLERYIGVKHAIATVNGTAALHICLKLAGVLQDTEVITQSLTFVATCNAIHYCGATPIFVDVDRTTLGLSPQSLDNFLQEHCEVRDDGQCWNRSTNRQVVACLPMHTLGIPAQLNEIKQVCDQYSLTLIEDAAESLGSFYNGKHTGSIGKMSAVSFNGNKIITTGGGGMILTNDEELAIRAKHLTTTAKRPDSWVFEHDQVGYNYRLPNLNAALGVAQMETLPVFVEKKRQIAKQYKEWGKDNDVQFVAEPENTRSNCWLNAMITDDRQQRDLLLEKTNDHLIMTRPAWTPMHKLIMYQNCQMGALANTEWLFERLVKVPSGVIMHGKN